MPFWQKGVPTGNKLCRPAKKVPMAAKTSRWPLAMAGGGWGWSTSPTLPLQGKTQVFGAKPDTKRLSSEILRWGTRAETSGNSERTQSWIITECSNGDVQVLRTVKNGVSTPLTFLVKIQLFVAVESCYLHLLRSCFDPFLA